MANQKGRGGKEHHSYWFSRVAGGERLAVLLVDSDPQGLAVRILRAWMYSANDFSTREECFT